MVYRRTPSYLWRHASGLWFLKRPIPPALQRHYINEATGKPRTHLVESLGTHSRKDAEQLKRVPLRRIEAEFARLGAGPVRAAGDAARSKLQDIREAMAAPGLGPDDVWALEDMADEAARKVEAAEGLEVAQQAYRMAVQPDSLSLRDALAERHKIASTREQTKDAERRALDELLQFLAVDDCLPDYITEARAVAFVDSLNDGPLSHATKKGRLSCLARLWSMRKVRAQLPAGRANIWHGHDLKGERRAHHEAPGEEDDANARPWTANEALRLFRAPEPRDKRQRTYTRHLFKELHVLGFVLGARLEEITSLRPRDVAAMEGGLVVTIRKGKTDAALRSLPVVHPAAVAILKARMKAHATAATLFPECMPGGKDRKTSHHVSKAMGRERDRLGFGPEVNFHSTRKAWAKLTLEAGLPLELREFYIGHSSDQKLIDRRYSQGAGVDALRRVAEAIRYPAEVEAEFAKVAVPG